MQPRPYEETVAFAVARMNERAVHREREGWKPDANRMDAMCELAWAQELVSHAYRVDAGTVVDDLKAAARAYDGPAADLREPDFGASENRMTV